MNPLPQSSRSAWVAQPQCDEMYEEVIEQEAFSDELLSILQNPQKVGSHTKIAYRLAWASKPILKKKAGT